MRNSSEEVSAGSFTMNSWEEFEAWKKSSLDTMAVERSYIDMVDDLIAGILLSQIVYWHLSDKQGKSRLRVNRDGHFWIAQSRHGWWDQCRITPKQFDRAVKILRDNGLVATARYKFAGSPTVHIRLVKNVFVDRVNSIFPKGEKPSQPKVDIEVDERATTLTETTTETTTETNHRDNNTSATSVAPVTSVMKRLEDLRGFVSPTYAAEAAAIKWMLANDCHEDEILSCWQSLKREPFWRDKALSMMKIKTEIGTWKSKNVKAPVGADKYFEGQYGHIVRR